MAYLFTVEGRAVAPNTETLLISPFKEIWERDKTVNKDIATEEFTYIEFMVSMKKSNPYRQYDESLKEQKIREDLISQEGWEPDDLIIEGIKKLKKFQEEASTTYNYYIGAKTAAEKMKNFFLEVDINERHPKTNMPIYKPGDITRALNDTEKVLNNLKSLEKKVEEELYESAKTMGNKEISPFAMKSSFK